jgi:AraC family transcriptional regulator
MAQATHGERVEAVSFGSPSFRSVEAGGLLVTDALFPPCAYLAPHVHERACVATTLTGSFDSRMRGKPYWSQSSMMLCEPAGERHDNRIGSGGARVLIVQPDGDRLELVRPFVSFLDVINHRGAPDVAPIARRLSVEIAQPDNLTPLAVEGLALELIATAARAFESRTRESAPAWLCRVRDYLHDDITAAPSLTRLATLAGVHPGHLTREFRRHYGGSIGSYLRTLRLDWAARRLVESDDPLAAIASSAGFADQSHFTRSFRAAFGCTPSVYRSRARGH